MRREAIPALDPSADPIGATPAELRIMKRLLMRVATQHRRNCLEAIVELANEILAREPEQTKPTGKRR